MLCRPRGAASVELDPSGYHNDGLRPITISRTSRFQRVGTFGKTSPRTGIAGPGDPVAATLSVPADKEEEAAATVNG